MRKYFGKLYGKSSAPDKPSPSPPNDVDDSVTANDAPPTSPPSKLSQMQQRLRGRRWSGASNWTNKLKILSKRGSSHEAITAAPRIVHPKTTIILSSTFESSLPSSDHHNRHVNLTTRSNIQKGAMEKPLLLLTVGLCDTYHKCNHSFRYNSKCVPRRVLTKPNAPSKNNPYDNEASDYILYVHDILGDTHRSKQYVVQDMLGSGTFGQVVRCRDVETGRLVGVKVIKSKTAYYTQALAEVGILKYLNRECDPNGKRHIIRLQNAFLHKHHLCLVFELLSINLYELLKHNHFRGLATTVIRTFCDQILDGLAALRDAGIIHCDLKPENILLESLQGPHVKIADFGSACRTNERLYTYIQSRFYRSPEVLLGIRYSTPIDMWSLGCIVAELFLGVPLFPGTSEYNQLSLITHVLGTPPSRMLDQGRHTRQFFNREETPDGKSRYTLKDRRQYMKETGRTEKPNKKYYSTNDLMDLILMNPMPHKHMNPSEKNQETRVRLLMADFLGQVLQLDPKRRLTPQEGRKHPFIMSAYSQARSVHDRSHSGGHTVQKTIIAGGLETIPGSPDGAFDAKDPGDKQPMTTSQPPHTSNDSSDLFPSYYQEPFMGEMPGVSRRFTR